MSEPFFDIVFDLQEEGDFLLIEAALPGVLETEIDVTLEGSRIIIRADRPASQGLSIHREIKRGLLVREFVLPYTADLIRSRFEDGVLWLKFKRTHSR